MAPTLEDILISVWRQALGEEVRTVTVGGKRFPVRRTSRSRLREVAFRFEDHALRGLQQNPKTPSRWARLAREGKKVIRFLSAGHYVAVVVDGKVQFYGKRASSG
jgi:fructose-1,6-bisphosphatase/inositol monophosphatase family enzyme